MKKILISTAVILTFSVMYCGPSEETKKLIQEASEFFETLPETMPGSENDTDERIALGKKLYFETRLSSDNTISCNSCHNVNPGGNGTDNAATSTGVGGQKGGRNAPTVLNAGYHLAQFWDGRAADLQAQAKGPILNPIEMAIPSEKSAIEIIKSIDEYKNLFAAAFPGEDDPITYDNLAEAIAAFERTLISKNRLDSFIAGNHKALSSEEQAGLRTFLDVGCTECHNGPLLGANSYRKIGVRNPYPTKDLGRYEVTKQEKDKYVFKVPSLRNIALSGPYFHDGQIGNLETAVKKMGFHQLDVQLSDEEVKKLVTFLNALSDPARK